MTFIDWSDPAEMLGLLVEYVAEARDEARQADRRAWLAELSAELSGLAERYDSTAAEDLIAQIRAIHGARAFEFGSDPVFTHLADCIAELERIQGESEREPGGCRW